MGADPAPRPQPASAGDDADDAAAMAASVRIVDALRVRLRARLIETHISWVLLDDTDAWKIKKPVRLDFLDARALATRERLCAHELALNRRLAPTIYLGVVPVTGTPDDPRLGGDGAPIDWALRMRRFPDDALLSRRHAAGRLDGALLDRLARRLAAFQRAAPVAAADSPWGRPEDIAAAPLRVLDALEARVAASRPGVTPDEALAPLRRWLVDEAGRLREHWQRRRRDGHVREGHGDLHLANIVDLGDDVTAFDCIEFDPALRWIDVLNDVAFLAMDLQARGRGDLAGRFMDAYLSETGDYAGLPAWRHDLVYRALVRALVGALAPPGPDRPDYLGLARRIAASADARLLITHGVSGSGKSHVAAALLAQAQAVRLRSDVERKRLHGLQPLDDSGAAIYDAESTRRTYARLRELAGIALRSGLRVIVDAAFLRADERRDFQVLADACGVPFVVLHCEAPLDVLRGRVRRRRDGRADPSEADEGVLERQLRDEEPLTAAERAAAIVVPTHLDWDAQALARRWLAGGIRGRGTAT